MDNYLSAVICCFLPTHDGVTSSQTETKKFINFRHLKPSCFWIAMNENHCGFWRYWFTEQQLCVLHELPSGVNRILRQIFASPFWLPAMHMPVLFLLWQGNAQGLWTVLGSCLSSAALFLSVSINLSFISPVLSLISPLISFSLNLVVGLFPHPCPLPHLSLLPLPRPLHFPLFIAQPFRPSSSVPTFLSLPLSAPDLTDLAIVLAQSQEGGSGNSLEPEWVSALSVFQSLSILHVQHFTASENSRRWCWTWRHNTTRRVFGSVIVSVLKYYDRNPKRHPCFVICAHMLNHTFTVDANEHGSTWCVSVCTWRMCPPFTELLCECIHTWWLRNQAPKHICFPQEPLFQIFQAIRWLRGKISFVISRDLEQNNNKWNKPRPPSDCIFAFGMFWKCCLDLDSWYKAMLHCVWLKRLIIYHTAYYLPVVLLKSFDIVEYAH